MPPDAASVTKRRSLVPAPFALAPALGEDKGVLVELDIDEPLPVPVVSTAVELPLRPSAVFPAVVDPVPATPLGVEPDVLLPGSALADLPLLSVDVVGVAVLEGELVGDPAGGAVLGEDGVDEGGVVELEDGAELVGLVLSRSPHAVTEAINATNSAGSMITRFFMAISYKGY